MTRAALGLAAILAALPVNAWAQSDPKPALSTVTRLIDASITIDPKLRTHPGLYDNLLAEGRREIANWRKVVEKEAKENPKYFQDDRKYSYERRYSQRSLTAKRYVSVARVDGSFEGGAHPNTQIDTILWDTQAKKRINVRPFFTEMADDGPTMRTLAQRVRIAAACGKREKIDDKEKPGGGGCKPDDEEIANDDFKGIQPKLVGGIGPISLAPSTVAGKSSGLIINYSAYAIGSYAEGAYFLFVPWTEFKAHLSAEGAAIFGGNRPTDDPDVD